MSEAIDKREYILEFSKFLRAVDINKDRTHDFLLGAGASITSGIKSAEDCIWDWKRLIFLTGQSKSSLKLLFSDASSITLRNLIQTWLDQQGKFPELNSEDEYEFYAQEAFGLAEDRRRYFEKLIWDKQPSAGYHLLNLMSEEDIVHSVWTTNFDNMVVKAATAYQIMPVEIGLDSVSRYKKPAKGSLSIIYLHGDFRYDLLKNTNIELQEQDRELRDKFIDYFKDTNLIVSGYSGRDKSVMSMLKETYSKPGEGRLYWCGMSSIADPIIEDLIRTAHAAGREAFYVQTEGFDDTMVRLSKHCLAQERFNKALPHIQRVDAAQNRFKAFEIKVPRIDSVIKSNLFPITLPTEVFQFSSTLSKNGDIWDKLREITAGTNIIACPIQNKIYAISTQNEILNVFRETIEGSLIRVPIVKEELSFRSNILYLFNTAVVSLIAQNTNLVTDNKKLVWRLEAFSSQKYDGVQHFVHKAVVLRIMPDETGTQLLIKPTIKIIREDGQKVERSVTQGIKRSILDKQYNGVFNNDLAEWTGLIFKHNKQLILEYPLNSGTDFQFRIDNLPYFAKVFRPGKPSVPPLEDKPKYYRYSALQFEEPQLLFSTPDGKGYVKEVHPLKGLVENNPFDFALTQTGLATDVNIGVICPAGYQKILYDFLVALHCQSKVNEAKERYLISYQGFESTYKANLRIPTTQDNRWHDIILENHQSLTESIRTIVSQIKQGIRQILSVSATQVIVIFIPAIWEDFKTYKDDKVKFDLRDHIKAFSAQLGVATQFLEEDTIRDRNQFTRIMWWLSLAFYAKSFRMPWVIDGLPEKTAFAGIGYSVDRVGNNNQIILGCSHIYNARGEGLKYRLSKINEPIIINRRPHLSYDDAFRFGTTIKQMFIESSPSLPERVVIHKRLGFTQAEINGINDGLSGIPLVDLIEINVEDDIRFLASVMSQTGDLKIGNYPVNRGICVAINSHTGLLFTHGATAGVLPGQIDFMGGKGIPSPLVIKKHYGPSSLEEISREINGLTKMNWNAASMYSKLPATILSSNQIAKIGSMLSRHVGKSFDYRLFI
jgi:hypothetical protein